MDTRFETMDCHASTSALARNDGKRGFFKQDSRACCGAVDFHRLQRILGFCDDFVGCRVQSKGAYLVYVTAALRDDSLKSAQKPNPPARPRPNLLKECCK